VDGTEAVGALPFEVDEQGMVVTDAVVQLVIHRRAIQQQPVKGPVAHYGVQARWLAYQGYRLFNSGIRQVRVDPPNGRFQISQQQYLAIITALRSDPIRRQIRAMTQLPTTLGEPFQALLLQLIFRHPVLPFRVYSSSSCKELVVI